MRKLEKQLDQNNTVDVWRGYSEVVCWGGSSTDRDRKRLNKLVRRASSILDCPLESTESVGERRMLAKLTSITRLWKPGAALSAADSYTHCVRRRATADHSSPQPSEHLTQALPDQSLSTHLFVFVNILCFSKYSLFKFMCILLILFPVLLHLEL